MKIVVAGCAALVASALTGFAHADCPALAFTEEDFPHDPIYEVVACGPAEPIVELGRLSAPDWYGKFSYSKTDSVITVRAANNDARKLMRRDMEYWYFPAGCQDIYVGLRFERPQLREFCCDVGPVNSLPCGVGGKQLMKISR